MAGAFSKNVVFNVFFIVRDLVITLWLESFFEVLEPTTGISHVDKC